MGLLLAILIWAVTGMTAYYMMRGVDLMLPVVSNEGVQIDAQFMLTLAITGVAFLLVQAALGWFIFRFRDRGDGSRAEYLHGHTGVEIAGVALTGVTFVVLGLLGQRVWANVHLSTSPADAIRVEITAEQFLWNMRYPGPDGVFGRTSPRFYQAVGNTVGILPDDPAGKDDLIVQNQLVVPVGRPLELILRSKDVLHSFFIPAMRLKQDTVPGLAVPMRFTPTAVGEYEVACAELCGMAHYRMRGHMKVLSQADYDAWLIERAALR